jgi:putative aldouronate transport system substrate-binding protein
MKKTKLVALGLAAVLALGVVGCGKQATTTPSESTPATSESKTSESTPAKEEKKVVSIGIQQNASISSYEDNLLTNAMEEEFGVEIEWFLFPAHNGDTVTKINLMATSDPDSLPDILIGDSIFATAFTDELLENEVLSPITDLINDPAIAPNFNKIEEEKRLDMIDTATYTAGEVMGFCAYAKSMLSQNPERMWINNAWLEALNLETPTTTEELKNVLVAFVNGDPNGNKIADEQGAYGKRQGYGQDIIPCIMNSFVSWNNGKMNSGLAADQETGETVVSPWTSDEWKDGIIYLNDLYNNGALVASLFSDDEPTYKGTINNNPAIIGLTNVSSNTAFTDAAIREQYRMIAPVYGPKGVAYSATRSASYNMTVAFTAEDEQLELCVKMIDAMFDYSAPDSIGNLINFGVYGEHWTDDAAEIAKSSNAFVEAGLSDGIKVVQIKKFGDTHNVNWGRKASAPAWSDVPDNAYHVAQAYDGVYFNKDVYDVNTEWLKLYSDKIPNLLPVLNYTEEEKEAFGDARSNIISLVNTFLAECTVGVQDVQKGWDGYIKEIKSLGYDVWMEAAQAAYDRQK